MPSAKGASAASCSATSRPLLVEGLGRQDLGNEADPVGLRSINQLAGEQEPECPALPDEARKPLSTTEAWNYPEGHLRLTELRTLGGQADIAGHRQLHTSAQREALHQGDRRLVEPLDLAEYPLASLGEPSAFVPGQLGHGGDVGSSGKSPALAAEDDRPNVMALAQLGEGLAKQFQHGLVQGVELLWSPHGDDGDRAIYGPVHARLLF